MDKGGAFKRYFSFLKFIFIFIKPKNSKKYQKSLMEISPMQKEKFERTFMGLIIACTIIYQVCFFLVKKHFDKRNDLVKFLSLLATWSQC